MSQSSKCAAFLWILIAHGAQSLSLVGTVQRKGFPISKVGRVMPAAQRQRRSFARPLKLSTTNVVVPAAQRRTAFAGPLKVSTNVVIPVAQRQRTSVDTTTSSAVPYWYDPRIHVWGNIGLRGMCHALLAPAFTALLDRVSYDGLDVRKQVLEALPADGSTVLDLCCGVGFSTAPGAHGVDTSPQMLTVARWRRPDCTFAFGNAETYGDSNSYDIVTVMFATHEMPASGRRRVLQNAMRVARKSVLIVDIDPSFSRTLEAKPMQGKSFLAGEPYVLDYLDKMDEDVTSASFWGNERRFIGDTWLVGQRARLEPRAPRPRATCPT